MTTNEELAAKVEALTERVVTLEGVILAVAKGLSLPRRPVRRWTTVADDVLVAQVAPEPVRPTMVILPPQESAEAAEKLASAARRILGEAFDAGAKVGGA